MNLDALRRSAARHRKQALFLLRRGLGGIAHRQSERAEGRTVRDAAGKLRCGLHQVEVSIATDDGSLVAELAEWLADEPFKGHWSVLTKGAGHKGPVFAFARWEDAMLMRFRFGDQPDRRPP